MSPKTSPPVNPSESEIPENEQSNEPEAMALQTQFAEDVVIEDVKARRPVAVVAPTPENPRRKLFIFMSVVAALVFVLVGMMAIFLRNSMENGLNGLLPTQNETPVVNEQQTELERDILLLDQEIEAADPIQAKLSFPPVDFDLRLEDATLLQEQSQRSNTRR